MSIAMSVERYADTATEFITRNRILLAAKTKNAPPAHPRSGRSFGLCDLSIFQQADDFNRICRRARRCHEGKTPYSNRPLT